MRAILGTWFVPASLQFSSRLYRCRSFVIVFSFCFVRQPPKKQVNAAVLLYVLLARVRRQVLLYHSDGSEKAMASVAPL